jgi:hypothetical protein
METYSGVAKIKEFDIGDASGPRRRFMAMAPVITDSPLNGICLNNSKKPLLFFIQKSTKERKTNINNKMDTLTILVE